MIKEWATVISWQDGIALLRCEQRSGCSGCQSRSTCGTGLLNQLGAPAEHLLQVPCEQPLQTGQRVELGIAEKHLLQSAVMVYFVPLVGLLAGAALFQALFISEFSAILGALTGGGLAFLSVKRWAGNPDKNSRYQPVILQIALPGELLHIHSVAES
ncbi:MULTISPECIES: SoxR-reducing system protein RseC [unclassified Brenneria]|uniref:SoxR-reducing system protein RseC n=1 Tax=unclassified Brenneria TaxID=2634434 RepID=UPI00155500E6|nr:MULTISPECIES: SoxR-reducing system protein RseC [unclassified Brenneria]MBJ7223282.1 SoxR-reducing system protein RseC [Brenneria sp. L3-3C-1]MEE3644522.1 SoxR-reducing system protein RseC [Brenneria sp. L3_3C_1]MEE3652083.1 SoxR-reducing system protein RseC [Brenneria sp. HEZEL_4_2_4]NPD02044.1 SoxR-reducing system protein RseC [Brenneria sp. hezel4-2-4]